MDADAVLFVMSTSKPRKVWLQIKRDQERIHSKMIIDPNHLLSELDPDIIPVDDDGSILEINSKSLKIFVYLFGRLTKCSDASASNFDGVLSVEDTSPAMQFSKTLNRNVGWSYFSLVEDPEYDLQNDFSGDISGTNLNLHFGYTFPIAKESKRRNCLLENIKSYYSSKGKDITVMLVDAITQTQGYCQFSGGGDILIHSNTLSTLVIKNTIEQKDISGPVKSGSSSTTTLNIEVKNDCTNIEKLKYQLYANIVSASVSRFVEKLESFSENDLCDVKEITGYGIAYTNHGEVGFFKIVMKFHEQTTITTKIPIASRTRPTAASIVDDVLDYCVESIKQLSIHD
ncbi:uncharacterized protein [Dysidea avara]|uniref:uncharacterized protein isoform X2 n=1 Tax=Dysidea avara TaxID=196820 RepID=UPI00332E8A02